MINRAVRYLPILKLLQAESLPRQSILEVGSGPQGMGEYYPRCFVGCDVTFEARPKHPMVPVVASALQLPFENSSFDAVIASDVLEHVPPQQRRDLVRETLRVARKIVLIGFPCGPRAYALDQRLWADYRRLKRPAPPWLEEHMLYPFPNEGLFEGIDHSWAVRSIGNDNLRFHYWIERRMMRFRWQYLFDILEKLIPRLLERFLRLAAREPCYRRIFALTRKEEPPLEQEIVRSSVEEGNG